MCTLLTATRLNESARITRGELSADGTEWTIPEASPAIKRLLRRSNFFAGSSDVLT